MRARARKPDTTSANTGSEIQAMAGNLPVPQGLEAKIVWGRSGVPHALTILHYTHQVGQTHGQARADTLDSLIKAAFTSSALAAQIHTTITLMRVESRHMDANSDPWYVGSGAAVPGTGTGAILPVANAFVITHRTGLRGRSYNGRTYLTGYASVANDTTGQITAAANTASTSFIQTITAQAISQLQLTCAVLSRWTTPPGMPPGTPATERPVPLLTTCTSHTSLDLRWDVQRRRATPGV